MRVRLRTLSPTPTPPRVARDEGHGVIRGASLISAGPALGHGFEIDATTLDQIAALSESVPGRWTHGSFFTDGLGTHLGRWKNVRREGDRVVGDFVFSATAKNVRPEGLSVDAPTYLMDLAEHEPDVLGVSAVLDLTRFEQLDDGRRMARVKKVARADYVADPAANEGGLFAGELSKAAEIHGRDRVATALRAWLAAAAPAQEALVDETTENMSQKHADELSSRDAKIAALEAGLRAAEQREALRKAQEIEARLGEIQRAAQPCAIGEAALSHVRALLTRGDDELADMVGRLLVASARAGLSSGQQPEAVVPLGAPDPNTVSDQTVAADVVARLRANGFNAQLSADGKSWTTAPRSAARSN